MHSGETVGVALRLAEQGVNNCEIARRTGVSRPTIREWVNGRLPHSFVQKRLLYGRHNDSERVCPCCGASEHRFDRFSTAYAYLLGMYLGDGCISRGPRDVFRLRIALDKKYPLIVRECAAAMQAVLPWNQVHCQPTPKNYVEVHAYSKSWPCLFPQHGPGKKHERKIELVDWQKDLVALVPGLLLRGLLHSDGCRFMNTGSFGWECPRYVFTNFSDDIKEIFCDACNQLGLHWTLAPKSVYVSRKDDVARLDEFVGPKR